MNQKSSESAEQLWVIPDSEIYLDCWKKEYKLVDPVLKNPVLEYGNKAQVCACMQCRQEWKK